jgi:peptide/nickel transport system substrate-binding protein
MRHVLVLVGAVAIALGVLGPAGGAGSKYGGVLTVGLFAGDPDSLDPSLLRNLSAVEIADSYCERLYVFNGKADVVPQLAAALPTISKDKLTYTIPLRKGILFNDGTPFNAQAVVTTIQRDLTLPGSSRAGNLSAIGSVSATEPTTVVVHLSSRYGPFLDTLATADGMIESPAQIAKLGANFGNDPVCVGPFMFDHRDPGVDVTVVKSPYYYAQGAVHFDKIVFESATDAPAALAALEAGDLQVIDSVPPSELPAIAENTSLRVIQRQALGYESIMFNLATPFGSNAKLRQAFEEAIDRNALVKVVYGGHAEPGCTPIAPQSPYYVDVPCTPYDPADARKLVGTSGVPNPTVHLLTSNASIRVLLAQFIQAEEAAVGINVVIDPELTPTVNARWASGDYEATIRPNQPGSVPDRIVYSALTTSGNTNFSGYSNPRLDLILANARKATSLAALKTLYRAAYQIVLADRPMIFLDHTVTFSAFSSAVTGSS